MPNTHKILIAGDHAGFELKRELVDFCLGLGYQVIDVGACTYDESDDYPAIIGGLADMLLEVGGGACGIIIGGSGTGEAIVANRHKGIRAVQYYGGTLDILKLAREHNDSNVLSLGARLVTSEEAKRAVEVWLTTAFSGDARHVRRIAQLDFI